MTTTSDGSEAPQRIPAGRAEQLVEVLVFLFLIAPSMILAQFAYKQERITFGLVAWSTIARDLALVSLILFFVWRNGEPFANIGWRFSHKWRDVVLGAVLFLPLTFGARMVDAVFHASGLSATPARSVAFLIPRGPGEFVLAFFLVVIVALAEETIFRGYLILRFANLSRSIGAAILLSALVFSLGHGYEGEAGMATVGVMGMALALIYVWRRSLVAPIVMHFLQDFTGIVLMPLLGAVR